MRTAKILEENPISGSLEGPGEDINSNFTQSQSHAYFNHPGDCQSGTLLDDWTFQAGQKPADFNDLPWSQIGRTTWSSYPTTPALATFDFGTPLDKCKDF